MGRVNKKVEKEENDDDDNDQWFDEFDQSLENYNDIGPHKGVFPINFWEKEYLQKTKGLSEGRGALNQQKLLKAHESLFHEKKR